MGCRAVGMTLVWWLLMATSTSFGASGSVPASEWRSSYEVYTPTIERSFVVDAGAEHASLRENHDASIKYFDGRFYAMFNGATNASEIFDWQLNRVSTSQDGLNWTDPIPLFGGCPNDKLPCNQWQPNMIVVGDTLMAFWSSFQAKSLYKAHANLSSAYMSTMKAGSPTWIHTKLPSPFKDTSGQEWRLFPTENPLQLNSGRVLVPVSLMDLSGTQGRGEAKASVLFSDNPTDSTTWKLSPGTPSSNATGNTTWEPTVIEDSGRVHMLVRATDFSVDADRVLQHSISTDGGESWSALDIVPITTVPNRPLLAPLDSTRIIMADSDWSTRAPLDSTNPESSRFNLALFFGRHGDGVRVTAGTSFTKDEEAVMYPQFTSHNGSLFVVYSQGFTNRSIKVARIFPLPQEEKWYVFPRSSHVGGSVCIVTQLDTTGNLLRLQGGSAGVDVDALDRAAGDTLSIGLSFRHLNGNGVAIISLGDSVSPLRVLVADNSSILVQSLKSITCIGSANQFPLWTSLNITSGGKTTIVSVADKRNYSFSHDPSNTWVYIGNGFIDASGYNTTVQEQLRPTNFSLMRLNYHPNVSTGTACVDLPRSNISNAELCFKYSSSMRPNASHWFWVYDSEAGSSYVRCCPKMWIDQSKGWHHMTKQGAFYQNTHWIPETHAQGNVEVLLSTIASKVTRGH